MTDGSATIRRLFGLLHRQRMLIASILALFALGTGLLLTFTPLQYSAVSLIQTQPPANRIEFGGTTQSAALISAYTDNQVELAGSDRLLLLLIRRLQLGQDQEFMQEASLWNRALRLFGGSAQAATDVGLAELSVMANVRDRIRIRRRGRSQVIEFKATSRSPAKAAKIANSAAMLFLEMKSGDRQAKIAQHLELVTRRAVQAERDIASTTTGLNAILRRHAEHLAKTGNQEINELLVQLAEAEAIAAHYKRNVSTASGDLAATQKMPLKNVAQVVSASADDLPRRLNDASAEIFRLHHELRGLVVGAKLSLTTLLEIHSGQQAVLHAYSSLEELTTKRQDLQAKMAESVPAGWIISQAVPPTVASYPPTPLYLAIATLFALGSSVGMAVFFETYVSGFVSEDQVNEASEGVRALSVPEVVDHGGSQSPADLPLEKPASAYSEAIRRLRTEIGLAQLSTVPPSAPNCQLILISSALPGEGKTTLAISLARLFAASGSNTLLIDGNLRHPHIHNALGLSPPAGIRDHLSGSARAAELNGLLRRDPKSILAVLPGSGTKHLPADHLLIGPAFENLMANLLPRYDHIIMDSPAVLAAVDAVLLARWADVVVHAANWASTRQKHSLKAIDLLRPALKPDAALLIALNRRRDNQGRFSSFSK